MDDRVRVQDAGEEPVPVEVRPVVARISMLALDPGRRLTAFDEDAEPEPTTSVDGAASIPWANALADAFPWPLPARGALIHPIRRAGLYALVVAFAVSLPTSDPRLGVMAGGLVGLWSLVRSIDLHVSFSFGSGFVGYRSDMGWPRGVQEEDDVRWHWRGRSAATAGQGSQPS